ncbi:MULTISPECIES: Do family serine endopeptidase [Nitrosomonas]|uniref:Htra-like serine protease signal peptide protein n=1 Tax=Nitrosomonas europaea (strain ATCC 19718 / CIP 103999 / KCTC 2705 / NBRC 14298) TaxID=228410 RepID=Q82UH7_NITEU|nr:MULTISPECIES: Do family serine endopeptidase [Nitrosomonas]KXK39573.1 MAG: htra-like serine protease signal peptide protein [Nitrosomonas europaea]MBV6388551.1 putative serine protease HtrA [Nitrosomonas europaea]MEB2330742.1 Do family serine endopeptidase [Nitrosomonas sp.]QOJ08500.1 MAG: Do family serine endopeptidase [Nitrosomonas sp. H1_AOB3]CAD85419.1 htra-like serine protease signal peptide protein [Nitrosomonas europaea ATCC 19718]
MQRLWLIFTQTVTVLLAVFFVVSTLRPELLPWTPRGKLATIREATRANVEQALSAGGFHTAAEVAMPSVVNIFTSKEVRAPSHPFMDDPFFQRFFGDRFGPRTERSLGSGVIVSPEGYILTNHHVVEAASEIQVALMDGRNAEARIIGSDPESDLAVLKIDLGELPSITFGESEKARVGDIVLAIGNPFGVGQTMTMGIIGALGRSQVGINTFENFIQTDAAINPGNSGGALTDTSGNLIGINTAIYSRSGGSLGIGFAIPVDAAKQIMQQIIETGGVVRGWLGVSMQDLTPELAESFGLKKAGGALIAGVLKNGPADDAGIKPGDVLVAVNGKPIFNSSEMLNMVASLAPGKSATLTILRHGGQQDIQVRIGKRPS